MLHILLVEDNPGDVRLTREAFGMADVETSIRAVSDGDEALDFFTECRDDDSITAPDLVLLDLNLPRVHGFDVLDEIRDDPDFARLPVLVLTSSAADEDIAQSYDLRANAHLTKPDSLGEFVELVEAVEEFWFEQARLPPLPA
ncbi:response regulator [Halostella sp. JP-L12]|uniref:response regulator n=1 Tax=Halostella TaxID=1843185 RepID=UPI000EF7D60C|nr:MULTISPECIES: response regulator [Halostella]NHN47018.1 response regulator [Halostella sp. JP-L12]